MHIGKILFTMFLYISVVNLDKVPNNVLNPDPNSEPIIPNYGLMMVFSNFFGFFRILSDL